MIDLVFLSNYFNHHQRFFSNDVNEKVRSFYFISTEKMTMERKNMGWEQENTPDYVTDFLENSEALKIIDNANVIIAGSTPEKLVKECIKQGKLVFRYSERPLKNGNNIWKYPLRFIKWHLKNPKNKSIYMLCASAYTASDYRKFGLFKNRTYKWGYFPETKKYNIEELFYKKDNKKILYCGRFIELKHIDDCIRIAKKLHENGYDFSFDIIGSGVMEKEIRKMILEYKLEGQVNLLGSMNPEEVRIHMEKAGIYLFTSDKREGWGAVLNESMNSGCAVVGSHEIGSVPFLIKDGENGFIYESGNINMLYEKVKYLLDNYEEQKRLGEAAYRTIAEEWNAETAAERFAKLAECILSGEEYPDLYQSGPCSKAEIIDESWFES